jgi:hypothetical protein
MSDRTPDPVELAHLIERAATLAECCHLAHLFEERGADAGIVRLVLGFRAKEAWKQVEEYAPLEVDSCSLPEAESTSSGAEASCLDSPPSTPLDYDAYLRHIVQVHDRLLDVLYPEMTTSLKVTDTPRLRVVE